MKAVIDISEETMNRLASALDLPPIFDGEEVDEDRLSYAIKLMAELCAD